LGRFRKTETHSGPGSTRLTAELHSSGVSAAKQG
jgi:hypothetical protein